jgi:hypothetical protein
MERTMAVAQVEISLHQLLNALEQLANDYPLDRLAPVQIERIETAARVLRERFVESKYNNIGSADTHRINWLEKYVADNSALMLHDGTHSNFGASGLAFGEAFDDKAFCPNRTLRKAIDECMGIK